MDTFTCRASALRVTSPLVNSEPVVANSANNPCVSESAQAANATVLGLATANVLNAQTSTESSGAMSNASVADVTITLGGNTIAATLLQSSALVKCTPGAPFHPGRPAFSSASKIATLSVNGVSLAVTGKPNQTITLPGGVLTIVISERIKQSDRITERALRVSSGPLMTNVVVAESIADVSGNPCAPPA
ncbi:hypothetical protein BH09ACT13_BH09ACT13_10350 [soil metagenome]